MSETNEQALRSMHLSGYCDALRDYAWWKDGVQYVGSCGTTLSEAINRAKADHASQGQTAELGRDQING